jgi:hypothetical protein
MGAQRHLVSHGFRARSVVAAESVIAPPVVNRLTTPRILLYVVCAN